ncbi:MAG: N-formylglutamate amidohydrolase, partial [Gammaproteobacteria bacterium]|nr:N-formylglutamate amidohydrolase [Gammaproteobacteria bacterium]
MSNITVRGHTQASIKVEQGARSDEHSITPLLLSFPHSGEAYPDDFGADPELPYEVLDFPNDKYVDELYEARNGLGLASVHALFPRVYIDVNRHQHDIDAAMLEDSDGWYGRMQPTGLRSGTTLFWAKTKEIYHVYDRLLSNQEL